MRVQPLKAHEENATPNQVPSVESERKTKRKMDRGRYMGRGIFKSPPQPHMCIQDSLIGSKEPCFINVLSWEKISMPANPNDPIPLYGGIRIYNNSMNALSCSNLWQGGKPGEQPVIFAVLANTEILKLSGKMAKDPNEREALIYLILDFIEVMNAGVQFQHHFKVLPDRDVVGELKDIWFIIQSKRDQERLEITYHGEGDRGIIDRQSSSVKIHKKDFADDADKMREKETFCLEQEKEKLSRSHSYPNGSSNNMPGTSWFAPKTSTKQHGSKDNLQSNNHNMVLGALSIEKNKKLDQHAKKIIDMIPAYQADDEEIVIFECVKPKAISPQKQSVASCSLPSASNYLQKHEVSKEVTLSLSESIENKVRGEIFTQMKHTNDSERLKGKQNIISSTRRDLEVELPSFTDAYQKELIKDFLSQAYGKISNEKSFNKPTDSESRPFDSFENGAEENNMFDQVRHVVATEILPSLDFLESDFEADTLINGKHSATIETTQHLNSMEIIPHCTFALKMDDRIEVIDADQIGSTALESANNILPVQTIFDTRLSKLTEALDTKKNMNGLSSITKDPKHVYTSSGTSTSKELQLKDKAKSLTKDNSKLGEDVNHVKDCAFVTKKHAFLNSMKTKHDHLLGQVSISSSDSLDVSKTCNSKTLQNAEIVECNFQDHLGLVVQTNRTEIKKGTRPTSTNLGIVPSTNTLKNNVQVCLLKKVNKAVEVLSQTSVDSLGMSDKKDSNKNVEASANINTSEATIPFNVAEILPCSNSLQTIIGKKTVSEESKTLEVMVSLHDQENNKLTIG